LHGQVEVVKDWQAVDTYWDELRVGIRVTKGMDMYIELGLMEM